MPLETYEYRPGSGFQRLSPAHVPDIFSQVPAPVPVLAYDAARDRVVMSASGRTWEWDGSDWMDLTGPSHLPQNVDIAYDPRGKRVIGVGETTGATYAWNGQTWQKLSPALLPPARTSPAMFYDPIRSHVVLYG